MRNTLGFVAAASALCLSAGSAAGQHAAVNGGLHTLGSNYFEQIGVGFSVNSPNFFFQQNSAPLATPQFGGATPGAGATTGFALPLPGGGEALFNITASQGSRASNVSQSPSVTLTNGVPGVFFDTTQTPFVTSFGAPPEMSPALERWQQIQQTGSPPAPARCPASPSMPAAASESTAPARAAGASSSVGPSGSLSVAQLRRVRAEQEQQTEQAAAREVQDLVERARAAEQAGKPSVARLYYEQAARRTSGAQRQHLLERARDLSAAAARPQPIKMSRP